MLTPSVGIFVFFFFVVGAVANSPAFHKPDGPAAVIPFWISAFHHYKAVLVQIFSTPQFCLLGTTVNEFQDQQCKEFWGELLKSGGLAAAPAILVGIFIYLGLDNLSALYKLAQKKIAKGTGAIGGTVTNPPDAPSDLYSWFYCFRPIMVQLATKEQIKVYIPDEMTVPSPGSKLIIFEMGKAFGEKRRVAMIYAPHVAVVRGE